MSRRLPHRRRFRAPQGLLGDEVRRPRWTGRRRALWVLLWLLVVAALYAAVDGVGPLRPRALVLGR